MVFRPNVIGALKAAYWKLLILFKFDPSNAFQATRQDRPGMQKPKLYCRQPPGFEQRDPHDEKLCCDVHVGLQGRIDATNLFEEDKNILPIVADWLHLHGQKKMYLHHNSPLVGTTASLLEILTDCSAYKGETNENGMPVGWGLVPWARSEFPEILLEIRQCSGFCVSRNFRGN